MRKFIFLFFFYWSMLNAVAQQIPERIRFEHLTVADGLTDNSVGDIIQDHEGYIWMGTFNGLVRYDGTKMTAFQYHPDDPYSLKASMVSSLRVGSNGDLWVGASSLFRFERATQRFIEYPTRTKNNMDFISFIHEDKQGNIWTITSGVYGNNRRIDRLDPKTNKWTIFRNDPKTPQGFVNSGTGGDMLNYGFAPNGEIWLTTIDQSENPLFHFDSKQDKFVRFIPTLRPEIAEDFKKIGLIEFDKYGHLFFSGNRRGLFMLDPVNRTVKQFKHDPQNSNSLMSDTTFILYHDSMGFIWIPSPQGIDRYDPVKDIFTHYISKTGDYTTPFTDSYIYPTESPDGNIWFPANEGLSFYDRRSDNFLRYEFSKEAGGLAGRFGINKCLVDRSGLVWAASQGSGINKQSRETKFRVITKIPGNANSLPDSNVNVIYEAPSVPGIIWFGTNSGLSRYDKKNKAYVHYRHDGRNRLSLSKGPVTGIAEDRSGRFWVSTSTGLNLMDRSKGAFTVFTHDTANTNSIAHENITCIKITSDGKLWMGTDDGLGTFDYDNNKFYHYVKADTTYTETLFDLISQYTAPGRQVAAIMHPGNDVDKTSSFDLSQPADLLITCLGQMNAKKMDYGWLEDGSGKLLWELNKTNSFNVGGNSASFIRTEIIHLSAGNYTLRYKSDNDYSYGHWDYPPPHHAGLWGIQLTKINASEAKAFNAEVGKRTYNGITDNVILSLAEDKENNLWIGTNSGGISKYDPHTGKFVSYVDPIKGPICISGSMIEDKKTGHMWVGDYTAGLLLMNKNGEVLKRYNNSNGLSSNSIMGIQQDAKGILWISTNNGLTRFDPVSGQSQLYDMRHGLQDAEFNINTFCSTTDGELYFAGKNGVNVFYPGEVRTDTVPPQVAFADLYISGKPATLGKKGQMPVHISTAKEITLAYDQNDLTFYFTTILFNRGNESRFAYKLSPNDADWINAGKLRQVRYTNLSPGTYTFTVKAANADGVWNEKGVSVTITILPPWWKTWWAYLLYGLIFVAGIFSFIAYRSAALKKENKALEEKVRLRTGQLETSIADLKATQSQLIQSEKMASLGELTAGIAHEIQNPLNFVNNFSELNKELIIEMKTEMEKGNYDEVRLLAKDVEENEEKINHHGKRADAIVKGMLQHSRSSTGQKEATDINALADEYLRLAYHGLRAKDKSFNATMRTDFDEAIGNINIIPQDIGRLILNLITNAFYAVAEKKKQGSPGYEPTVTVITKKINGMAEIRVKDNGPGIPQKVLDKIFQPFFTTKPTGQGTGLGLSLAYDIVKAHGGELSVAALPAEAGRQEGAEFVVRLPVI